MDFSVQIMNHGSDWKTLRGIAAAVDGGTWKTLWNYDHLVPPMAEMMPHLTENLAAYEEGDTFEGWSLLAAWAEQTKRVRLGCLVTAVPFRNPALLAKMAATIDHISGGRLELGVGAAWHTGEARAYGIALGGNKEKLDRFGEALEVLRLLLTPGPRCNFSGQYYRLDNAPFAPQPVQEHLPILIGGGGEKRTLRYVAQYADSYNFFANVFSTPELYNQKSRLLDEHCAAVGRNPADIRRTVCIFADLEDDDARARARREFFGKPLEQAARDGILFGNANYIVDGTAAILEKVSVDEVIFCGLEQHPERFQRFDEEVLRPLQRVKVVAG